jgi:hypothetical protein
MVGYFELIEEERKRLKETEDFENHLKTEYLKKKKEFDLTNKPKELSFSAIKDSLVLEQQFERQLSLEKEQAIHNRNKELEKESLSYYLFGPSFEPLTYNDLVFIYNIPKEDVMKFKEDLMKLSVALNVIAKASPNFYTKGAATIVAGTVGATDYYIKNYEYYHKSVEVANKAINNMIEKANELDLNNDSLTQLKEGIMGMKEDVVVIANEVANAVENVEKYKVKEPVKPELTTFEKVVAVNEAINIVNPYLTNKPEPEEGNRPPSDEPETPTETEVIEAQA